MKATNKGFRNFTVDRVKVPKKCKSRPDNFKSYVWETQDGRLVAIKEFNDWHLINTFNMLVNARNYAKKMSVHKALTHYAQQIERHCAYHLSYIGHEVYLRHYAAEIAEGTKKLPE